jgi:hypothetical protein
MNNDPFFSVRQGSVNSDAPHQHYMVECERCGTEYCIICYYKLRCPGPGERPGIKCEYSHFIDRNNTEPDISVSSAGAAAPGGRRKSRRGQNP